MFHHIRLGDKQQSDMSRMARRLTGCAVGLVLGGAHLCCNVPIDRTAVLQEVEHEG